MAVTTAYEVELLTQSYNSTAQLLLQQTDSRLRGAVTSGTYVGKRASPVQYMGQLAFRQAGGRGSPLQPQVAQYQRRWVTPADKDLTIQVDSFDELRTIIDPRSVLTAGVMAAGSRTFDDLIIAGFFGSAQTGVDESSLTTETFNSGANFPTSVNVDIQFGAGVDTGLTVKKIIEGRRILQKYENDPEAEVHIAVTNQQVADLMQQLEFISTEYRQVPVYDGAMRITRFLGCTFHYTERLQFDASDTDQRYVPMWIADGMHLGVWKDMQTIISQRNDLTGHPWQAYTMVSANATRLQAGKVIQIECLDGSGAAISN